MSFLFIADLHLGPNTEQVTASFLRLLERAQGGFQHLFILGDLFEAWVGDDDDSDWLQPVEAALQHWTGQGARLSLQQGNRDFLLGEAWAARCAAALLPEEHVLDLPDGQPALLMHGDSLCSDDVAYQNFRQMVRQPAWQAGILAQSLQARHALARGLREQSAAANANKAENIMDVNAQAVQQVLARHAVDRLIHGHTHRPAHHRLSPSQQRYVLGDWQPDGQAEVLMADTEGLRFGHWQGEDFSSSTLAAARSET